MSSCRMWLRKLRSSHSSHSSQSSPTKAKKKSSSSASSSHRWCFGTLLSTREPLRVLFSLIGRDFHVTRAIFRKFNCHAKFRKYLGTNSTTVAPLRKNRHQNIPAPCPRTSTSLFRYIESCSLKLYPHPEYSIGEYPFTSSALITEVPNAMFRLAFPTRCPFFLPPAVLGRLKYLWWERGTSRACTTESCIPISTECLFKNWMALRAFLISGWLRSLRASHLPG